MALHRIGTFFNRRISFRQRLIFALMIFTLGIAFHTYAFRSHLDIRSLLGIPLLAVPYAIPAFAALFTRALLGAAVVTITALTFFTYDLIHLGDWLIRGKEAGFTQGTIWMGEIWIALQLSLIAVLFGGPVSRLQD